MLPRLLLSIAVGILLASCSRSIEPACERGVLDLRAWDFQKRGPVELRGEWEFYFGELVPPAAFASRSPAAHFIACPSVWTGAETGKGPAGPFGAATYRLTILLPAGSPDLGIRIGDISGASVVYANGKQVASSGRIDLESGIVVPDYKPVYFQMEAPLEVELVIHAANLEDSVGGRLWYPGNIGTAEQISSLRGRNITLDAFVSGLIFIVSVFFFTLYAYRRFDATSLIFATMCLGMAIYQVNSGEHIGVFIHPGLSYNFMFRVRWLILCLIPLQYNLLFAIIYPKESLLPISWAVIGLSLSFASCAFLVPMPQLISLLLAFHLFASAVLIYLTVLLVRAALRRKEDAHIFALGLIMFIIGTVNDSLMIDANMRSIFLLPIGQSGFIFFWAVALSRRFTRDYQRAESLSAWNDRLRELDEAKTNFFANSSHELRTPLTLIASPLEGILSGRYGETMRRDHQIFGIMKRNADRLKRLTEGLLDFLKIETGSIAPSPTTFDLGAFIERYVAEFAPVAEQRGLALVLSAPRGVTVRVDQGMLETAVLNLLSNALKFTPRGGRVAVSVESVGGKAVVAFEDTGIGISPERIHGLFDRFSSSSERNRSDYSGFGIGLPLSAGIVKRLDGALTAESEEGKGSVFRLTLQTHEGELDLLREASPSRISSFLPEGDVPIARGACACPSDLPCLLIVDDDRDMLRFLCLSFGENYATVAAESGAEALRLIKDGSRPRAIVCDLMMPGMDGFQLKAEIDRIPSCVGIPFIFLTAKAEDASRMRALAAGAVDYVLKPFSIEDLEAKVDALIALVDAAKGRVERRILEAIRADPREDPARDWRLLAGELDFSDKDIAVAELVMEGLSDKEIARRLGCAPRTVSNRLSSMLRRSRVPNRGALISLLAGRIPSSRV